MYYTTSPWLRLLIISLFTVTLLLSSCVSYRVQTKKQAGAGGDQRPITSLFWGILQSPNVVVTPVCDSLAAPGLSEVSIKRNFGNYLLSTITLGIYNRATLRWECSKPCPVRGTL
jgi:hypothetical protein